MADDGLNCFKYLVQRSFFQIEEKTEDGEIFTCRMHDLMHDLAMSVAGEEVKMLRYGSSDGAPATGKTRHMSLHKVIGKVQVQHVAPLLQGKKARTLIFQCTDLYFGETIGKECLSKITDELSLRVLSLQRLQFKMLPSFIDKLKHLRQLDLSGNRRIKMLPDTITRLHNLQELNMDGCEALKKLPRDMEKLVNLLLLGLKGCYALEEMPRGIGKLTSLEVLSRFSLPDKRRHAKGGLDELEKLNKLKGELKLSNLQRVKKGAREWQSPEEQPPLHFSLPRLFKLDIDGCPNLKGWMPKLPSLKDLELDGVSGGLLEETLKKARPPSTSTGTPPLQSLYIGHIVGGFA